MSSQLGTDELVIMLPCPFFRRSVMKAPIYSCSYYGHFLVLILNPITEQLFQCGYRQILLYQYWCSIWNIVLVVSFNWDKRNVLYFIILFSKSICKHSLLVVEKIASWAVWARPTLMLFQQGSVAWYIHLLSLAELASPNSYNSCVQWLEV